MLGLGSNNALNSDLISGLKKADETAQKSIYQKRLDSDDVKVENLSTIKTAIEDLKSSMDELGTSNNYNALKISGNNTVNIKVNDADVVDDFNLNVTQKARKGIIQSNAFSDLNNTITTDQTLVFSIGNGGDRNIDFSAGTTYQEIIDRLNLEQGIDVSAVKINDTDTRLSIATEKTGIDNAINIVSETSELNSLLGLSDTTNIVQSSQNSKFTYNGIDIERSNNNVKDVVPGVEFDITNIGDNNVSLDVDANALTSSISNMVDKYNNLVTEIKSSMEVDNYADSFQTTSEIRNIMRSINNSLFANINVENSKFTNLTDLGIVSHKDGTISIGTTQDELGNNISLLELSKNNFKDIKNMFSSVNDKGESIGLMNKTYDNILEKMLNSSNTGSINQLSLSIAKDKERLNTQLEKTQSRIDKQYELMTQKFAAFDALIQSQTAAFSSLKLQIDQSTATPSS